MRTRGPKGDRRHAVVVVVAVLVLALAGAVWWFDVGERLGLGSEPADPVSDPAAVEPPRGLELPDPVSPAQVAPPLGGAVLDPVAVRRALGRLAEDRRLGRRVSVAVAGTDGVPVLARGPAVVTPASTLKLVTALAALDTLGPEHRFTTSTRLTGRRLVLVGGGDPLLAEQPTTGYPDQADVETLAARTARELKARGRTTVQLAYDDFLFSGPPDNPFWEADYLPDDVVSPITALWVDEGREEEGFADRSPDPSRAAADAFAEQLRTRGIRVAGRLRHEPVPPGAARVAAVQSAELVEVVQHVLEISDNEAAEVLARHVALAEGVEPSFVGAGQAVAEVLRRLGVPIRGSVLHDGSGLSRTNRLSTNALLEVLALGVDPTQGELGGVAEGLPVAGFSGSLSYRFGTGADSGLGWVRAKTGTLTGVHGLAGIVTGRDGAVMLFVAIADRVKVRHTLFARDRLDQIAAALAACRCSR